MSMGPALALAVALLGAPPPAEFDVAVWRDRAVDLASLRRFDFVPLPPLGRPDRLDRLRCDGDLRAWLREALEERGYRYEAEEEIDFLVFCLFEPPGHAAPPPGSGGTGISLHIGRRVDNRLYIELRDPDDRLPIWRGQTSRVLRKKAERHVRLQAAVRAVVEQLPAVTER